jgi:NitT/TauT family transport system substrate-binding protein
LKKATNLLAAAAAALVTIALAACAGGPSATGNGSASGTPLALRLDWTWGAEHTGYVVADALGYYKAEGLNVTTMEGEGSAVTATILAGGKADVGIISAGEVLASVSKGLPIQSVATVVQSSPTAIVYNKDRLTVNSLKDLYGHSLGVVTESSIYKEWRAVAALNQVDFSKIKEVAVGQAIVQSILTGQVDAITGWTFNQGLQAQVKGANVGFLTFGSIGLDIPNSTIAVNNDFAAKNPEAVKAFLRATAKGWEYTIQHPDEALKLLFKAHPQMDTKYNTQKLPLVTKLMGDKFGAFNPKTWQALHDLYASQHLLGGEIKLDGQAYTNKYLPSS